MASTAFTRAPGSAPAADGTFDPGLANADLLPVPPAERTWSTWSYAALWMGMVHSAFGFSVLGGMIATGMSAVQALVVVFVANMIQLALMVFTGRVGARFGIPFAVWARSAFGILGANVPALLRGAVAIGWFGVQSYLGATAINVALGAVFGGWRHLDQQWAGVAVNLWIAMVVYWAANFLVIRHGMETVRRFESWAGPMIFIVMVPALIWALVKAHGLGPIFDATSKYTSTNSFLLHGMLPGVALFISASWATMVLNLPDLTRFARSNRDQALGTAIGLPIATIVFYVMAAIIVSGTQAVTGKVLWNPADVLVEINIPVLTIIGGLLIAVATMSVNVAANLVSPAYDITNFLPRLFTFKRAASLAIVLSFAYMPWKLMETPGALFQVINNIGGALGPATGILLADFFIVRRRRLAVDELYMRQGRYWAHGGVNITGITVLVLGTALCLLGQVIAPLAWAFEYAWFVGLGFGFVVYLVVVGAIRLARGALPHELAPAGDMGREAAEAA